MVQPKVYELETQHYRAAMDNSADILFVIDPVAMQIIYLNDTACRMTGFSRSELLAKKPHELKPLITEQQLDDIFKKIIAHPDEPLQVTTLYSRKDGSSFDVEISLCAMAIESKNFVVASVRDITTRKKSEEQAIKEIKLLESGRFFQTLINNLPGYSYRVKNDKDYTPEFISEGVIKTTGYTADEYLVYRTITCGDEIIPEDRDRVWNVVQEAIKKTQPYETTYRILTKAGEEKWVWERGQGIWNDLHVLVALEGFVTDITYNKRLEQKLIESESTYRSIVENLPGITMRLDLDENIQFINCTEGGYTKEQIIGTNAYNFVMPEFHKLISETHKKVIETKTSQTYETIALSQDGIKRWFYTNAGPIIIDGKVTGITLITRDITGRKIAEQQLSESEKSLRQVLSSAEESFYVIDKNYRVTLLSIKASSNIEKAWGKSVAIGTNILEVIPDEKKEPIKSSLDMVFAGQKVEYELHRTYEDLPEWVLVSYVPVYDDNEFVTGAYISTRDITKRKKIEEAIKQSNSRFEMIALATNDAVWDWDLETGKLWGNQVHQHLYGLTITDPVPSEREWTERIHPDDRQRIIKNQAESLLSNKNVFTSEYRFLTKENGYRDIYDRCYIIHNKEGQPIRMMGNMMDITERKKAEEAIKLSEAQYRTLVENAPEALVVFEAASRKFVSVSESAIKLFKMPKDELLKIGPVEISPEYQPDGRLSSESAIEKITAAIEGSKPSFEWTHCDKEGNLIPCEVWLVKLPSETQILIRGSIIDITSRKEAEKVAQKSYDQVEEAAELIMKSNARFQIISKATSDIVWDWEISDEPAKDKAWYNDNYFSIAGIEKTKELIGTKDWYNHVHPDDLNRVKESLEKAIKGTVTTWRDEYRYIKSDGTLLNFFDRAYIMRDSSAKAYRVIGSMVDMTPIYNAQKEMKESENRLRTIFETEPECIKLLSRKNELLDMNPAGLAMIEADSLEEVKGKSILGVVAARFKKSFTKLTQDVFEGKSGTMEFEIIGLKGTHRVMETHAVPLKNSIGEIISLLAITRDVTEKKNTEIEIKQNEEKYKTLVEQAIDAIALYDETGKVLDVNTGSVKMLGYTKEELIGMSLKVILTEEEIVVNPVRYDILRKGKSTIKQRRMRRKDGSIVETEVRSQQLPDGRFLSVIRDLTERIEAERELGASYKAIRKLTAHIQNIREEERTSIAREIHDELGQQLTVLKMDVSWLRKKMGVSDEVVKHKFIDLIAMLDQTVNTVRRISSELRPSLLDDLGLVAAMEWQLGEFEKRSGLNTSFIHSGEDLQLPDLIRTALFRIFQESLTNVARHSDADLVTVTITKKNDKLILSIADNGKGFDKQKIVEKKTLGILGMKERVSMIGGEYEIKSNFGKGTEVFVRVPLKENIN